VTRYRNETVYRSAQQLIAARRPPRKVVPRSLVFLGGIVVGLLLAGWAYQIYSSGIPREVGGLPAPSTLTSEFVSRRTTAPAVETVAATSSPKVGAPPTAPIPEIASGAVPDPASTEEAPRPALRTMPVLRSEVSADRVSTVPGINSATMWTTVLVSEFTLRGFLQSAQAETLSVEFALHLTDASRGTVEGVVRLLDGNTRVASNRVVGEIVGRTLTLRETGQLWRRPSNDYPRVSPSVLEVGRSFVLPLPERTGSQLIIGTWSQANLKGTLQLAAAPPW
jgi:hypothetical protein